MYYHGKKWDLRILDPEEHLLIEEHFGFFTCTFRANFEESYSVICHLRL